MALVLYKSLEREAKTFARQVEDGVLDKKKLLTEEEMSQLIDKTEFVPKITQEVDKHVEEQVEELVAQEKDKDVDEKKQEVIAYRRAELSEKAIYYGINRKRRRMDLDNAEKIAETFSISMDFYEDWDRVDEDELLNHDEDDDYWDDQLPALDGKDISSSKKMEKFLHKFGIEWEEFENVLGGRFEEVMELMPKVKSIEEFKELLETVYELGVLRYNYFIKYVIQTLDLICERRVPLRSSRRKRKTIS